MKVEIRANKKYGCLDYHVQGAVDENGYDDLKFAILSSDPVLQVSRLLNREIISVEEAKLPGMLPSDDGYIVTLED